MKNIEVAHNFINKRIGSNYNGKYLTDGVKLYSYQTVIAQWIKGRIIANKTKYSLTTSRHLGYIKNHIFMYTKKDVPIESKDLSNYI